MQAVTPERLALFAEMELKYEQKDTEYFVSLLEHSDYVVRTRVACILVDFGGEDKIAHIAKVLKNDENEVLAMANDVNYGLSATLWTNDLKRTMRVSKQLEVGIVWVNTWLLRDLRTPFGGVKSSGVGREGGFEALRFFTEPKNICIKYN